MAHRTHDPRIHSLGARNMLLYGVDDARYLRDRLSGDSLLHDQLSELLLFDDVHGLLGHQLIHVLDLHWLGDPELDCR